MSVSRIIPVAVWIDELSNQRTPVLDECGDCYGLWWVETATAC